MQAQKNKSVTLTREDWSLGAMSHEIGMSHIDLVDESVGYDDTIRWPIWKTATFVVAFCASFWIGAGLLVMRLMG